MVSFYLVPNWFFGFGVILEVVFAIIASLVAMTAIRIYRASCQNEFRLFGFSFASISLSYFLIALINLLVVSKINENVSELSLSQINTLSLFGLYLHILLFVSGLMLLCYTTLKLNNSKVLILFVFMELFLVFLSANKAFAFFLMSALFLSFLIAHYTSEYIAKRNPKTLSILFSFVLLLIARGGLILSVRNYTSYVISHVLELAAYTIILANLIFLLKHGKKKK